MQAISLFTGIGGFEIAFNQVFGGKGKVIQSVEIDADAQSVLRSHFPNTPIHPDICTYKPDVNWNYTAGTVFGGFPCTNTSCAGDRTGLSGIESSLWFEMLRVIATTKPRFVLVENPTGLINRGLRAMLGGLRMAGYTTELEIISAAALGAPHQRERLFVIAYPNIWSQEGREPPAWSSQIRGEIAIARSNSYFPMFEQRNDGADYGFPTGLDEVPLLQSSYKLLHPRNGEVCHGEYPRWRASRESDHGEYPRWRISQLCAISVPQGTPGRIKSRYLYGRSVVPGCAAVAFHRIKFLEEWWGDG